MFLFGDAAFGGYPSPVKDLNSAGILFLFNTASNRPPFLFGKEGLSKNLENKNESNSYINRKHKPPISVVNFKSNKMLHLLTNWAPSVQCHSLYKQYMRCVDWADLRFHMFYPSFRNYNWKHCILYSLFYMSLNNASTIYDQVHEKKIGGKGEERRTPFLDHLIEVMLKWTGKEEKKEIFNKEEHYLCHDQFDETEHRQTYKPNSTRTVYWCNGCSDMKNNKKFYITKKQASDLKLHKQIFEQRHSYL